LYALLSRLTELPIRQDLAVTGSVNQWGEVQAIGGANEKIEGFFDICKVGGLTGQQGVLIPVANVRNLILRLDVIDAVERGQFHIYPVRTIDEGIALLTGVRAGTSEEEGTINGLVNKRLRELATNLKAFGTSGNGAEPKKTGDNDERPEKDKPKEPPA
jgi:predicted ATP-dependent protease